MLFMWLFWVTFGLFAIAFYARERWNTETVAMILLFVSFSSLIVAIATDDPLIAAFGVPAEYEWVVGLSIAAITSWRIYFNPMKERLMRLEKRFGKMEEAMQRIGDDVRLIKEKLLG
jgi:hypothetical protein